MTVVSSGNTITFAGDGVQNVFDFNFRIFRAEDLCAVLRNGEGSEERLVLGSDFKIISGVGSYSGGRVQYPISGDPLPSGQSITLYREIAYTQELELVDNDPFSAQLLNEAFDRGVMRDQQLQEQVDRALKYDISTPGAERLTPQEMVLTITNARNEAVSAHSGAQEAEGNAREMLGDAQAAQNGSEAARDKALLAQSAAEEARDSAIQIAVGDLSPLRSSTPVLSARVEVPEGTTVSIVITDHSDDGVTSYEINTFGFGTASISGNTISWTLATTGSDISKGIEVVRRRRGELYSDAAIHQVLVKHIDVQDGPTIAYSDSIAGYPGASVDADGIHAPAHSVGTDNANQIVSASTEIYQTSGKLNLLDGTSTSVLKLGENYTGPVVTDQGETNISSCTDNGDGSYTAVLSQPLPGVPAKAIKKTDVALKVGGGSAGEYLGPKKVLTLKSSRAIPIMTSATTGGFTLSSGGVATAAPWAPWNAADGDITTVWQRSSTNEEAQLVVSGPFTAPVTKVSLQARDSDNQAAVDRMPKSFTIEGYQDGAWTVLNTVANESVWSKLEKRDYAFANGVIYQQYKISITATEAGDVYREIGELALLYDNPSSTTAIVVEGNESVKDQIFKSDGLHRHLLVDGQLVEVESVTEEDNGNGIFIATIFFKTALAQVPTDNTEIAIPDRCILAPASYTQVLDGGDLKITGAEITLEDNPALKRLALAVSGDGVTFKGGKIYIKEKP